MLRPHPLVGASPYVLAVVVHHSVLLSQNCVNFVVMVVLDNHKPGNRRRRRKKRNIRPW